MTAEEFYAQLDALFDQDEMDKAGEFLRKALAEAQRNGDIGLELSVLNEMMGYSRSVGEEEMGLASVERCVKLIGECGLRENPSVGTMWINIGTTLCRFDRIEESLLYYGKAQEFLESQPGNDRLVASFCNNVASAYTKKGDYEEAEKRYRKALALLGQYSDSYSERVTTYGNLAELYALWGKTRETRQTLEQMDVVLGAQEFQQLPSYEEGLRKCAEVYERLGDTGKASQLRNRRITQKKSSEASRQLSGLELSERYFFEIGLPALREQFPEVCARMAAGLAGEGSECMGYDDMVSRDHDFAPDFCVWLSDEDYERFGADMQKAYDALPKEYNGVKKIATSVQGEGRRGILRSSDFYRKFTGGARGPETLSDWLFVPEYSMACAVNGKIFQTGDGMFMGIREKLQRGYPEDVRKKKIAARAVYMAQSGQYNYGRCLLHGEEGAAMLSLAEFVKHASAMLYLLNRRYCTYYKWMLRGVRELPVLGEWERVLAALLCAPNEEKNIPVKQRMIEELCGAVIAEMKKQGLSDADSDYLEPHGFAVMERIEDAGLRAMHVMQGV